MHLRKSIYMPWLYVNYTVNIIVGHIICPKNKIEVGNFIFKSSITQQKCYKGEKANIIVATPIFIRQCVLRYECWSLLTKFKSGILRNNLWCHSNFTRITAFDLILHIVLTCDISLHCYAVTVDHTMPSPLNTPRKKIIFLF